ncbi:MAG: hypothetical protein Q4C60_11615 [Eubacteriales bacterium]|nr:hypothetical protein [Eubacteriales bacterium]
MSNFERKFGRYAIRNLSLVLILCYAFGYMIEFVNTSFLNFLTLNPYAILHGQIWRVITWVLVPPDSSNIFFVLIMLFFYYSIGTSLERTWGTYRYNVYIFSGILFTVAAAFLMMGFCYLFDGAVIEAAGAEQYFRVYSTVFSTYYVNMSIFLAFAVTFPDMQVLLMFIIPLKVKWLGIIYAVMLAFEFIGSSFPFRFAMIGSLLNFLVFWLRTVDWRRISPKEVRRRASFRRAVHGGAGPGRSGAAGQAQTRPKRNPMNGQVGAIHRCAVCGRTEIDNPNLEFRYCSKCEGNYEYCQDHIFTHIHVHKNGGFNPDGSVKINPDSYVNK